MRSNNRLTTLLFSIILLSFVSCGPTGLVFEAEEIQQSVNDLEKKEKLAEDQLESWYHSDIINDTIPGMSVERAYDSLIRQQEGDTVIVAVVDSGVDIAHEDLEDKIWKNEDEVPGNNKDDDENGYIDDVYGWNFLGDIHHENLEMTRILRDYEARFEGKSKDEIAEEDHAIFESYKRAKEEYKEKLQQAKSQKTYYTNILQQLKSARQAVADSIGHEGFTLEEVKELEPSSKELSQSKNFLVQVMSNVGDDLSEAEEQLQRGVDYFSDRVKYHYGKELNATADRGNDPDDFDDTEDYGNNDVDGPDPKEDVVKHGTHVAGIIAAERNNGIGMNGVASNAKIMAIRAVPDGDEYDKDIAHAIRYAVDNGAKVINTSFGKYYSTHPDWVIDAIQYAAENDVLIVNAAGNEGIDLDEKRVYPNDQTPDDATEVSDNFINIGAIGPQIGESLVAGFSNYGKANVDIFAPGASIYSTVPNDEYEFLQGTSMAAPAVSGIAAMIRSYYPELTAAQVKQVIMRSGIKYEEEVILGGDPKDKAPFTETGVTGRFANLYNALIEAHKMSNQ